MKSLLLLISAFCFIKEAEDLLFEQCDYKSSFTQLTDIHTPRSHILQYFIKRLFNHDIERSLQHLIAGEASPMYNLIYSHNSYFSIAINCNFEKVASLYLETAKEIIKTYEVNKHAFKSKRLLENIYAQKSVEETLDHIVHLISAGDSKAEEYFIKTLQGGRGEPSKYEKILVLLAERGNAKAMGLLGEIYLEGRGVEKCINTAMHYFTEGANKKNAVCYNGMGKIYDLKGEASQARKYYEEASKRNLPEADFNLYNFIKKNYKSEEMGIGYLISAANRGFIPAIYAYSLRLYETKKYRNSILYLCAICDYSLPITELLERAEDFYIKKKWNQCLMSLLLCSEMGSTHAMYNILHLCDLVNNFDFIDKNAIIFKCNQMITDMGYKTNIVKLGDCYFYGIGTPQSYKDAFSFYLTASLYKYSEGIYSLAYMYENGLGVKRDLFKSLECILDVNNLNSKAYLLVWYVCVKLGFKIVLSLLWKREFAVFFISIVSSYFGYLIFKKKRIL